MKVEYHPLKSPYPWQIALLLFVMMNLVGCTKKEFMPAEVGENITFTPTSKTPIAQVLQESNHTLFRQAWKASNVESILIYQGYPETGFTLLAPSDEALMAKGWTQNKIAASNASALDTLVLEHLFMEAIAASSLAQRTDHYPAVNLIEYRDYYYFEGGQRLGGGVTHISGTEVLPYRYRAYLNLIDDVLFVNGKKVGSKGYVEGLNSAIWSIDKVLERPRKLAIDVLKADPQFSLYMELLEYSENLKLNHIVDTLSTSTHSGFQRITNYFKDRESIFFRGVFDYPQLGLLLLHPYSKSRFIYDKPVIPTFNTWFIPTNEAFHKHGFYTVQDFIDFNSRNKKVSAYPIWMNVISSSANPDLASVTFTYTTELATDTLLDYHHNWARRQAPTAFKGNGSKGNFMKGQPNISIFYSTDLLKPYVSGYQLNGLLHHPESINGAMRAKLYHYMPLEFSGTAGNISVKAKGSKASPAKIVESDIMTLNGPIHAVDDLIIPPNFKLR